jgi:hypothetical protein
VPPLRFGEGRECTLPASIAVATGTSYEWVMGGSGAAFTTTIDTQGWGSRAAGMKADAVTPPFDDEMKELVIDRVLESLEAKRPALARGLVGPAEYGLVVGIDDEAPVFYARTYFDKSDQPSKVDWSAFRDEQTGHLAFLDPAPTERAQIAREAVRRVTQESDASQSALNEWLRALRDDTRWSDTKHAGTAAFADHAMRTILADKRRAAAAFLREARALFSNAAGAELLRAAESYGYVVEAAKKIGTGPFDASVAMRFLDVGHRRAWAKQLEAILDHERAAHAALAAAAK